MKLRVTKWMTDFLDKSVDGLFATETDGRKIFFPFGFGAGRVIPDVQREGQVRHDVRRMLKVTFAVTVPLVVASVVAFDPRGLRFVLFFLCACALGFLNNVWLRWTVRDLPVSATRRGYFGAMTSQLDRFGPRFLKFGLITSLVFAVTSLVLLIAILVLGDADGDAASAIICAAIFGPLAWLYWSALRRSRQTPQSA